MEGLCVHVCECVMVVFPFKVGVTGQKVRYLNTAPAACQYPLPGLRSGCSHIPVGAAKPWGFFMV